MQEDNIILAIREVADTAIPKGAKVILFGSQARGDSHNDSDWDLLILIDRDSLTSSEHEMYSYPFWELGWKIDAMIHPAVYSL